MRGDVADFRRRQLQTVLQTKRPVHFEDERFGRWIDNSLYPVYNAQGQVWRYHEAPAINYYEVPVFWTAMENAHDLQSGRYLATGVDNEDAPADFSFQSSLENFTPQALRTRGVR